MSLSFDLVMYGIGKGMSLKGVAADVAAAAVMSAVIGSVVGWVLGMSKRTVVAA
jgi:diacylglycerol kinase